MKNIFKRFGLLITVLLLVGGFFVNVPLVHAETSVSDQTELLAALADVNASIITLDDNITLTSTLIVARTVTINGAGFTLTRIANNVEDIESYAIMVSAGTLTASNLKIVSTNTGTYTQYPSAVGITVQTGASLNLSGSTITAQAVYGLVYGVYAQAGATAVTLNTNQFIFSGADTTTNAHRIMLGMTGIGTAVSLTSNTITSTLHTTQQEVKLAVCADGTDCGGSGSTLAAIKTFAETGNKVAVGEKLRATASDATIRTIYTRTSTGWTTPVTDEAELLAALAGSSDIVLGDDIPLSAPLVISRTVIIDGGASEFTISGNTITTSGAVTLKNIKFTGTENYQVDDGNYGIWVASGTLTADNIHMTVVTNAASEADNDGFNVASGASLDLKNSTITLTGVTKNQHGVYAQSGAVAVTLTDNTFSFPVRTESPYSYLISTEGATVVADYPTITLTGMNTQNAYLKLLLVGDDTLANKERYAAEGNKVAIGERLGVMGVGQGIYPRPATGWNTSVVATAIAGVTPPVREATPVTTVTAGTGYTGTVTWSGSPSTFDSGTVYTATITLSATDGYSLVGVEANQFTIAGSTSDTNSANSGVIIAVFPRTASASHGSGGGSGGGSHDTIPPVTPPANETPQGCSAGNLFNTSTGAACVNNAVIPQGCSGGNVFNTSTGATCTNNAVLQIPGCGSRAIGFSTATGGSCTGNHVTAPPTPPATGNGYAFGNSLVREGTKGGACLAWQTFLNVHGASLATDGSCGKLTMAAARAWQVSQGLVGDGLLGAKSRAKANE